MRGVTIPVMDRFDRPLRDLRISVTDRCNFRCTYCMPREVFGPGYAFLPSDAVLSFDEITRLARLFIGLGVEKIRITGGEPLVRRDIDRLIAGLAGLEGLQDLTLTTNGLLLARQAEALKRAGLRRITVSLDTTDDAIFRQMNGVNVGVDRVVEGLEAARQAGLWPIKVNMVVQRGVNDHCLVDVARAFHGTGMIVRFIEYMDVGNSNGWRLDDVVAGAEIVARIGAVLPLEPAEPNYRGEVAARYRYLDGGGEIGIITSVTQPFCGDCSRARLSSEGRLYTCLFAVDGVDLREMMRAGADDATISTRLRQVWRGRSDRYSELRSSQTPRLRKVEMSHIGG